MIRNDLFPDDVLLEIFYFHMIGYPSYRERLRVEAWKSLVHMCRRWRNLVFRYPHRLNLRLFCTPQTPVKDRLDVWPALPLVIKGTVDLLSDMDNIIAALGQTNRVRQVDLDLAGWQLENILALMQVSFPELTDLRLSSHGETPVIPDSFLGGSAPRLRSLTLHSIPFPGLPKLLLSATHLVELGLYNIPHSGYISPREMAALLSALLSLETLSLEFRSPQPHPDRESRVLPPPKPSILPILSKLLFKGVSEYLEELVTRIDTPQLEYIFITFFNQIDFDCPRVAQFINSTPTLRAPDEARVIFGDSFASVKLRYRTSKRGYDDLWMGISCGAPDWQLSSIEQVCNSTLYALLMVEDLYIEHQYWDLAWKDDAIENNLWLELLLPFTAVKNLYLSKEFAPGIAAGLQELVGDRIMEVLPSLHNIFVAELEPSGPFQENIGQFVAARQLSDRPITIFAWSSYTKVMSR